MIHKYPFVRQEELKDCGVASLLMIIKFYRGYIPIDQLREWTKTNKQGTTAYHLVETAKSVGFDAKGIECDFEYLKKKEIPFPCIAHVIIENSYKHYLVIYEIDIRKKCLTIADPADKIKKISFEEFEQIWTKVLIVLYPTETIPFFNTQHSFLSFMGSVIQKHKKTMIQVLFLSMFTTAFSIASAFYFKYMVDNLATSKEHLIFLFALFLSIGFLKLFTNFGRNQILLFLNQKLDLSLTLTTMTNIFSLPYRYYRNHTTGELISRINDLSMVKEMIGKVFLHVLIDLPLTVGAFLFLYFIHPALSFFALALSFLYFLLILIFHPIYQNLIREFQEKKAKMTSNMVETISAFETMKGLGIQPQLEQRFETHFVQYLKKAFHLEHCYQVQNFLKEFISEVGFELLILLGCLTILDGKLTVSQLLAFHSLFLYFISPIQSMVELDTTLKEAKQAFLRVDQLYIEQKDQGIVTDFISDDIHFNHLSYSFDDRVSVLKDVSLTIPNCSKTILIGNSGSGKSTMCQLLKGYDQISKGMIQIGHVDLQDYQHTLLDQHISYVSQNELLFQETVIQNICISGNNEHFLEIAELCEVNTFMDKNLGYHTLVEENGFNLSGGEKQRLILARALMKPFDILVIDEGLSQMDVNLERRILKRLLKRFADKTIIIVSHRMENLDLFDQLVELKDGGITRDERKNRTI